MPCPLLLGSDFINAHGIRSDPKRRLASVDTEEHGTVNIDWLPWETVQRKQLLDQQRSLAIDKVTVHSNADLTHRMFVESITNSVTYTREVEKGRATVWDI